MSRPETRQWPALLRAGLLMAAGVALLAGVRYYVVMRILSKELDCGSCMVGPQLLADGAYLALFAALLGAGLWLKGRLARLGCRVLALAMAFVYLVDVFVYRNFHVRLDLRDVVVYGDQARLVWQQFVESWSPAAFAGLMAAVMAVVLACVWLPARRSRGPVRWLAVPLALAVIGLGVALLRTPAYPGWWIVRNVVAHNLQTGMSTPYAPEHAARLREEWAQRPLACLAGSRRRPNIVVLIAEGWSPYHSRLFTGFNDWTPRLDHLASQGRYFTALHAGGSNTNAGLISILLGHEFYSPIKGPLKLRPYDGLWGLETSLPKRLGSQGYRSTFMTNGNLAFSGKGGWMADIGFDEIHGHDSPEYEGRRRLHFDAAADEHLYRKALAWLPPEGADPWLLVLENVSSHHPYTHPHSLERNERKAFGYMDQTMDDFIRGLAERGFLKDNLLVVLSDHRAMTRVTPAEKRRFGLSASSRIPGFVLSGLVEAGRVDIPVHQADLLPSLLALVSEGACARQPMVDLFHDAPAPARCLFHAPNSDWNAIHAYCPDGNRIVRLAGSDSKVEGRGGSVTHLPDEIAVRRVDPGTYRIERGGTPRMLTGAPVQRPALPDPARVPAAPAQSLAAASVDPLALPRRYGCNIERLNSYGFEGERLPFRPASDFVISGWLIDEAGAGIASGARLVISAAGGGARYEVASLMRTAREDILAAKGPAFANAGFRALLPAGALPPGDYDLALVYDAAEGPVSCGVGRGVSLLPPGARPLSAAPLPEGTSPAAGS